MMMMAWMVSSVEQSLVFLPLGLAVYLSYQVGRLTDLTAEGSFVLGAGAFARFVSEGYSPVFSLVIALFLGFLAGWGVSWIQASGKISPLISGILAWFMLHSLNFCIMGRPNIGLYDQLTLFSEFQNQGDWAFWAALAGATALLCVAMWVLLRSTLGLTLRAFGCHARLLERLGRSAKIYRILILGFSNLLAALAGIWFVEVNRYADLNMGFGMLLTAIATVLIGRHLIGLGFRGRPFSPSREVLSVILGIWVYFLMVQIFLLLGINPIYLKLLLGVALVIFLKLQSPRSLNAF